MFDRHGSSREAGPHQHRVHRVLDEPRILFSVGSGIAALPKPLIKPFSGHDDLRFLPAMGKPGRGSPALRCRTPSRWPAGRPRQEGLRDSVSGFREVDREPNISGRPTSRAVEVLRHLSVSARPREDPGRGEIRWCCLHRRKDRTDAGHSWVPTYESEMAEDGGPCAGIEPTQEALKGPSSKRARSRSPLSSGVFPDSITDSRLPTLRPAATAHKRRAYQNPPDFRSRSGGRVRGFPKPLRMCLGGG